MVGQVKTSDSWTPRFTSLESSRNKDLIPKGPGALGLLLRSNLVQQELCRMSVNSFSLLNKTLQATTQVNRMLGELLEREVTRDDPEWAAAMALLTVSEKIRIKPSRHQHEENERDCRTVVQQLVSSIPEIILVRISFNEKRQKIGTQKKTVTYEEPDQEWIEIALFVCKIFGAPMSNFLCNFFEIGL